MLKINVAAFAISLSILATCLNAQTFLNENFSTGSGLVPPAGWVTSGTGTLPAPWRFNNPGSRAIAAPFAAPFAISDPDINGSATVGSSTLTSPAMNLTGTTTVNMTFDQQLRDLTSGWSIDVFDGSVWNTVAVQANNGVTSINIGYLQPNANSSVHSMYDITAAAAAAPNAQTRFVYTYAWDWWWAIDNVLVQQPQPIDVALLSIDAPVDNVTGCLPTFGLQSITITIQNQGGLLIPNGTLMQIEFSVNGAPFTTDFQFLVADLAPNASTQLTYSIQANLPSPGPNNLTCRVVYPGDGDPADDAKTEILGGGGMSLQSLPYVQNFDGALGLNSTVPPAGWLQDTTDAVGADSDWYMYSGQTGSLNTGPLSDHTSGSGFYAYVEDSSGNFAQVNLISPCMDLTTSVAAQCTFWLHSFNGQVPPTTFENFLSVDVIAYPGGIVTTDVVGPLGHQAAASWAASTWSQQLVNLAPFSGQVVQLRFRGRSDGGSFTHDIAIDDVVVIDPAPTPGQAPRVGLASFDINNSKNVNAATVASGSGGPYFGTVTQGGPFALSFTGEANQPIAVVYGALNPVSATYPGGIGQFDIGGPGVDGMGLPLNIAVFVNAIGWAQNGFPGFPIDAMFFTNGAGNANIGFVFPNFGIPSNSVITTFQSAVLSASAPFVYISNAIQMKTN